MTDEIRAESGGFSLDLGHEERAVWTTAFINTLPDSSFLYVESGGSKDDENKTTPRTLRHFPYKDTSGKVDLPHLRNALARIPQSSLPDDVKASLTAKAKKILADQQKARAIGDTDEGVLLDGGGCANCGHPLDDHDGDEGCTNGDCGCDAYQTGRSAAGVELRYIVAPLTHVDVRGPEANEDGTWTMSGYAAVFNRETVLHDGKFVRLTEDIDPGFFDDILRNQPLSKPEGVVHYNFGHDMNRAVAASDVPAGQPGSLQLRADANGLFYLAKVARDDPDGVAMASKMRTGVLRQASFAFTVAAGGAETTVTPLGDGREQEHRRLMRGKHLYDICATPQGAYPQTVSQLRSYAAAMGQPTIEVGGRTRQPDEGGVVAVSPATGGGVVSRRLTAKQRIAVAKHKPKERT